MLGVTKTFCLKFWLQYIWGIGIFDMLRVRVYEESFLYHPGPAKKREKATSYEVLNKLWSYDPIFDLIIIAKYSLWSLLGIWKGICGRKVIILCAAGFTSPSLRWFVSYMKVSPQIDCELLKLVLKNLWCHHWPEIEDKTTDQTLSEQSLGVWSIVLFGSCTSSSAHLQHHHHRNFARKVPLPSHEGCGPVCMGENAKGARR